MFTASFQATLSTGALVGGIIVDRTSLPTVILLGGATAVIMVMTVGTRRTPLIQADTPVRIANSPMRDARRGGVVTRLERARAFCGLRGS